MIHGVENIIKGRIAAIIVSLMFQEAGYIVLNYGHNGFSDCLIQLGISKTDKVLEILRNKPSFVVLDQKNNSVNLVQIKYRGVSLSGRNIEWGYKKLQEFWPAGYLLSVCPRKPYFHLVAQTEKGLTPFLLVKSEVFKFNEKLILKYGQFVKKFIP